jgi:fructosamine-3-kinase
LAEVNGLEAIRKTYTLNTPEYIGKGILGNNSSFLCLEYIEPVALSNQHCSILGEELAKLHGHHALSNGWDEPNFISILPQNNQREKSWVDFYLRHRLKAQFQMAYKRFPLSILNPNSQQQLYNICRKILIEEKPSLLHGDLWSGNILVSDSGNLYLIDPAVYYGHREVDIAMTKLFGGFGEKFYSAYNATFPLEAGWEERIPLYQLYYLLVHLNLFGSAYLPSIVSIIKKYN